MYYVYDTIQETRGAIASLNAVSYARRTYARTVTRAPPWNPSGPGMIRTYFFTSQQHFPHARAPPNIAWIAYIGQLDEQFSKTK